MQDRNVHKNNFLLYSKVSQKLIGIDVICDKSRSPSLFSISLSFSTSFSMSGRWGCTFSSWGGLALLNWCLFCVSVKEHFQKWSFSLLWKEDNKNISSVWLRLKSQAFMFRTIRYYAFATLIHEIMWTGICSKPFFAIRNVFCRTAVNNYTFIVHQLLGFCIQSINTNLTCSFGKLKSAMDPRGLS